MKQIAGKSKGTEFYCFSPFVMIATFAVEMALMVYVLIRDRFSLTSRLSGLILGLLATFQLTEYAICEGLGLSGIVWARIGFVAITMLPVIGLHLILTIAKIKNALLLATAYLSAALWFALFATYDIFGTISCTGNYVIFELMPGYGGAYFAYYYLLLFGGMFIAVRTSRSTKNLARKSALRNLVLGYLLFITPATIINYVSPETAHGLPSIMCGFALMFALALVFKVLPYTRTANK